MNIMKKEPSLKTKQMLESLERAVANTLERKRRLGHYAVSWKDGRVVLEGEHVPDLATKPAASSSENLGC